MVQYYIEKIINFDRNSVIFFSKAHNADKSCKFPLKKPQGYKR